MCAGPLFPTRAQRSYAHGFLERFVGGIVLFSSCWFLRVLIFIKSFVFIVKMDHYCFFSLKGSMFCSSLRWFGTETNLSDAVSWARAIFSQQFGSAVWAKWIRSRFMVCCLVTRLDRLGWLWGCRVYKEREGAGFVRKKGEGF